MQFLVRPLSVLLLLSPLTMTGCAENPGDPGIPGASWWTAPRDGTLNPNPASPRIGNPNTRQGGPAGPTYSPPPTYQPVSGAPVYRDTTSANPINAFPYDIGRQPPSQSNGVYQPPPLRPQQPATVYPSNAERARAAGDASLYPPPGQKVNPDPARNPTVYPR